MLVTVLSSRCAAWVPLPIAAWGGAQAYPECPAACQLGRAECARRIGERLAQSRYAGTCKAWCYMGTGRFTEYRFYWLFNFGPHTDYRLPL